MADELHLEIIIGEFNPGTNSRLVDGPARTTCAELAIIL